MRTEHCYSENNLSQCLQTAINSSQNDKKTSPKGRASIRCLAIKSAYMKCLATEFVIVVINNRR